MVYLYMIGLGLGDENDVTLKGLNIIKQSKRVFLESYTSILTIGVERLSQFYGKQVEIAYRETCEIEIESILDQISQDQEEESVYSFLVVGDPFCATTHSDLFLRASSRGIKVKVIHNASIMNAIGITGLQVYLFGPTVSVPFFTNLWKPYSFLEKIAQNYKAGQHTLVLLDIKVREISEENLIKGKNIFEKPSFMSVNTAIEQIIESQEHLKIDCFENIKSLIGIGLARVGANDQLIVSGTLEELLSVDFGAPLHSLVLPAKQLHHTEQEMIQFYKLNQNQIKNQLTIKK